MKFAPHHLVKEYVGEILKSFDKFQVVTSSVKVFTINLNGPLSPTVSAATPLSPATYFGDDMNC